MCHGMEYHFFDNPTQVKILPHKQWNSIAEPSWVKILNGQPIWLNITGMSMASHKFEPQGTWTLDNKRWTVFWYTSASRRWRDILVRQVPGVMMVKCNHIRDPYREYSILVAYRQHVKNSILNQRVFTASIVSLYNNIMCVDGTYEIAGT